MLQNWRLQPRKEALVRLRYARTLFEETDNDIEAETALSKGVSIPNFYCGLKASANQNRSISVNGLVQQINTKQITPLTLVESYA